MKPAYIVAFVIMAASLVFTLFVFGGAIAQHVSIQQAMAKPGETVQVPGKIVKETVHYDTQRGQLRFDVIGMDPKTRQPDPAQRMTIAYAAPKPENFDSADTVEAIGKYRDGEFRADSLLVKCPSKYSDEKPGAKAGM